ncbi:uncharacterized protein NECHADRAFT_90876 [Fusarium vanettenii 77-13-4]|uniref:Uncharacterized protein n=1 Tax=Fusarium vanettenii (strain ATCC MYA-4622 / CBS 123669 / FGSC 9596 / NRRL 45880 / 77-13-4) TaxID=660122 RepID=C7Z6Z7_FUSV7|nr:uncharacterized protein NECHADRAFT_90876 [Fusarium vanettenii 77-13-4]EEU40215.1 hypothetical protein NECHADRAFT_90876 [Fusarium vanettenii 77-13-4]
MSRSPSFCLDAQLSFLSEENDSYYLKSLEAEMKQEKERYPGASSWAPAEERLFEILFMRQDLPMLPPTWDVDLRGVPLSDVIFKTSDDFPPIIYAHSKDFRATLALTRLIDLTAKARVSIQSGLRRKVSHLIKRELDKYISWAAQDADYAHLRIVPNIMTEVVDTTMSEYDITEYIQGRMRSLAKLQREFLREDSNPQFWDVLKPSIMASPMIKVEPDDCSPAMGRWSASTEIRRNSHLCISELSPATPCPGGKVKVEPELESPRIAQAKTPSREASPTRSLSPPSPVEPQTPPKYTYRRHPPVVYGLVILNTSVLLLTTDSSKGSDAYVSFQVQIDFQEENQSVWNALTIAIAVCLARDELRTRVGDFEELPCLSESDPDA